MRFVVRPKFDFAEFELLLSYEVQVQPQILDKGKALAIDLGVENFATCVDDAGQSFIIDGRYLKSILQGFEKYMSKIKSMKHKQRIQGYTKREKSLLNKRQNKVEDYLNKSVHYIVDYCIKEKIGNIVVGYGYNFTSSPNLGHQNNQLFSLIPYFRFFDKLSFQCRKNGIWFKKLNESYTSKASFFDDDPIPESISRKKWEFSGRRRYRGLYVSKEGIKVNADLNAALNIMKKFSDTCKLVSSDKIAALQSRGCKIAPPKRIRVLNQTSFKEGKTLKPQK